MNPAALWPWLEPVARWTALLVIATGLAESLVYFFQLLIATRALARHVPIRRSAAMWRLYSDVAPPIALLVPAYNEEATIVDSVRSLLSLQYPAFEVIVVNDGSKDRTLETLVAAFGLGPILRSYDPAVAHAPVRGLYGSPSYPNLIVVDKENGGGKADALNAGINLSRAPLFCAIDADSILEPDALFRAVQPFIDDPAHTVVVGGTIRVINGCRVSAGRVVEVGLPKRFLPLVQTIEYLRAFLMARLAWSEISALTIVSGAFGIFRRSVAVAVGGYSRDTVGEDFEIIIKIRRRMQEQRKAYVIRFVPEPVCWTEAPESLAVLKRQRVRWQRGSLETFFKHWRVLFRPRYGQLGLIAMPNTFLVDVLGPPVQVLGYLLLPLFWTMGALSLEYMLAFLALTFTYGVFVSVGSLILEEIELRRFLTAGQLVRLFFAAVAENFGYRQLNNWWRVVGWWRFLCNAQGWGAMTRTGFRKG